MDYLPYQRIVKDIDATCAEWEALRGLVEEVVGHRVGQRHEDAERILNFELPRKLAPLADAYSAEECQARVEALFREAYSLAAIRRTVGSAGGISFVSNASEAAPERQTAPPARRVYREPQENDIASMIDDMLSGHSA